MFVATNFTLNGFRSILIQNFRNDGKVRMVTMNKNGGLDLLSSLPSVALLLVVDVQCAISNQ